MYKLLQHIGTSNYKLRFEVSGMWGCVLGKQLRGLPKCVHRVGSQTARVSINTALITRNFSRIISLITLKEDCKLNKQTRIRLHSPLRIIFK